MRIWPRLSRAIAVAEYQRLKEDQRPRGMDLLRDAHWRAIGTRADSELLELRERTTALAERFGFGRSAHQSDQAQFDREAAFLVRNLVDTTFAEAASEEVWSYIALAVLPDVTKWRFGAQNRERFIATDLTRHTWARLWWQAEAFRPKRELLLTLSEGDLNQLFERRSIGGDGPLVRALTAAFKRVEAGRREVVRDATKRMRRVLAFVETASLNEEEVKRLAEEVVTESVRHIEGAAFARITMDVDVATSPVEQAASVTSVLATEVLRDRVVGQVEPSYRNFRRSAALSSPQLLSKSVLRSVVAGALQIEGPVTRRRLRRLVAGTPDGHELSQSAGHAIDGAIDLMSDGGQIEIDDPFRSGDRDDYTLRLRGRPMVRIRPRGDRELQDVPPRELIAVAGLAPGRARVEKIAFLREFYNLNNLSELEREALLRAVMTAERLPNLKEGDRN